MKTVPKTLLMASAIAFALSLTGPGSEVWYGIFTPASALLFVAAFIVHVVSKLDPTEYASDNALREKLIVQEKRGTVAAPARVPAAKEIFAS